VLPNVSIKVKKKKKLHLCIVQQYIYLTEQTNKQKKLPHFHFLQRTRLKFSVVHTFFLWVTRLCNYIMTFECFLDENCFSLTDTNGRIVAESYVTHVH